MATKHKIFFYPVGNGDTSQIILSNQRRILMDFRHQIQGEDTSKPVIDLQAQLRKELKDANRDYFDVVAFTHADMDHIAGSTNFFELLHAQKYQGEGRIKIRELWVPAAMLLESTDNDHQQDEFVLLRQEARFRLLEGKGIRVFSQPEKLMDWLTPKLKEKGDSPNSRDHLFVDAGTLVPGFSISEDGVEFFCHSPFIAHCDDGDIIRNDASLIFNVRFDADGHQYDYLAVGDADWTVLEEIVNITRYHQRDHRLAWNLFNIPHHGSYKALSDEKGSKETIPKPLVKELLMMGKNGAYLVSSSHPIKDDTEAHTQSLPPHIQAKKAYLRCLDEIKGRSLLVTMEEPSEKRPEPILFEISSGGMARIKSIVGAMAVAASRPARAGI